ncbi:MAG: M23 family metallopeptidase [Pseudomonadota bacterium]
MVRLGFFALGLAVAAGACATSGGSAPSTSTASAASVLSICPKMNISNAPATIDGKRLADYSATKTVRGVTLLRAPAPSACLSSGYGPRRGGASGLHKGVDLFTRTPKPIIAAGAGRITFVGVQRGYGKTVIIDHGRGVETVYAHLSSFSSAAVKGASIEQGARLGRTGDTGNASAVHLHYEIRDRGRPLNPLQ